jgi:predicted phosphodiesterase
MTKIFAISDLHLEFHKSAASLYGLLKLPVADICILAGDIGYPRDSNTKKHRADYSELLRLFKKKYEHVILVVGNHEYYQTTNYDRDAVLDDLRAICAEQNVHLLRRNTVKINNIKFIGTTLWSAIDSNVCSKMGDFQLAFKNRLDYLGEFKGAAAGMDDYRWLRHKLSENNTVDIDCTKVVITHHLPTEKLIHSRFADNSANTGFYTDIIDELNLTGVKYWFCGHTHEYSDYVRGETTFIANPFGYPNEPRITSVKYTTYEI